MKVLPYLAITTFVAGIGMLVMGYVYRGNSNAPVVAPVTTFNVTPSATDTPLATATGVPSPTATPVPYNGAVSRFKIPKFNVDAAVENIGILANNELDTPHDPHDVGWYGIYSKPGFDGNAVFSAHVDYYGLPPTQMPFHRLKELKAGDTVVVQMDNGLEYTYSVISFQRYAINNDGTTNYPVIKMGELIAAKDRPPGAQWITLITCGNSGPFRYVSGNSGPVEYLTRDVVVAQRIS